MRNTTEEFLEGCSGMFFIFIFLGFFGLVYYANEAYPKTESVTVNQGRCVITLHCGSLCDSPGKLIDIFQKANPRLEVEGYDLSEAWNGDKILKLHTKEKK